MTKNPDGTITLDPSEATGVDALLISMDRRCRDVRNYTLEEAAEFAKKWAALPRDRLTEVNGFTVAV